MLGFIWILGSLLAVQASDSLIRPPSYLVAYVTGDASVKLSWQVKVPSNKTVHELRWKIKGMKGNESSMRVDGTTGTVTVHNLKVYTPYLFRIRRGYVAGKWGNFTRYTLIWTPEGVPTAPPANVTAYNSSSVSIMVFWSQVPKPHRHGYVLGYKVCYEQADKNDSVMYCTTVFALGIQLGGLKAYTPYWITVLGFTNKGEGPNSKPQKVWTDEFVPTAAPQVVSLKANTTAIHVQWDPIPQEQVNGILRGYYVIYWKRPRRIPYNHMIQVNQSALSAYITGLERNTTYAVRLTGLTKIRGWLRNGVLGKTYNVTTKYGSAAPENVKVSSPCSTCLTVVWDPVSTAFGRKGILGYQVTYKGVSQKDNIKELDPSETSVKLINLKKYSIYTVTVAAITDEGLGDKSQPVTIRTKEDVPSRAPDSIKVTSTGPRSIKVDWTPVPLEHVPGVLRGYHVYYKSAKVKSKRSTNQAGAVKAFSVNVSSLGVEITGLEPYTTYDVWVSAFTDAGSGPSSTTVSVTTNEDVPTPPRGVSVKSKEGSRLVLEWRRPESMNGLLRKYVLHSEDSRGNARAYTVTTDIDNEYVTYEMTLPNIKTQYQIKVQAFNSLPGHTSDVLTVHHSPSIQVDEARQSNFLKSKLIWLAVGLVAILIMLIAVTIFVLVRRESRRSRKQKVHKLSIISTSAKPSRPIPVRELADHCAHYHENSHALFVDEFRCLDRLTWKSTWEASQAPFNKWKNRYLNVVAYDQTRVVLTSKKDVPGSDYINANYVDGYSTRAKYIATQGPMKETVNDFWRMIWEKNVKTIVMIDMEGGELLSDDQGSEKYWHETEPAEYGNVAVSLLSTTVMTDWKIREFIVWSADPQCMDKREIFHYQFTSWPDQCVPPDSAPFLMFLHKLKVAIGAETGPIVVHCSAGVGRTGTFIAIDSLVEQMETEKVVDVYGFVAQMRKQRNFMVKTVDQYWFIYEVLRDLFLCGVTAISSMELGSGLMCLNADEPEVISKRTEEFEHLQVYTGSSPLFSDALIRENVVKNRCPEVLPFNGNRVRLGSVADTPGADYINASLIDGYNEGGLYIATQGPMASTVDDFWGMVWEQRSTIVVMLTELQENGVEQSVLYWPEEGCAKYGKLRVTKIDEEVLDDHTQRVFKIKCRGSEENLVLYHFQYRGWQESGLTVPESLLYLHQQVHKIRSGERRPRPIIIHCSNGDARTGVFLTLSHSIERLEAEDSVDLFQTVRWLRSQRPGLVGNLEQYIFCYKAVKSYLGWRIRGNRNDYV